MVEGYVSQCVVAPAINMHAIVMRQTVDVGSAFVHESGQCDHWCGHTPQSAHTHTHTHTHACLQQSLLSSSRLMHGLSLAPTRTFSYTSTLTFTHLQTLPHSLSLFNSWPHSHSGCHHCICACHDSIFDVAPDVETTKNFARKSPSNRARGNQGRTRSRELSFDSPFPHWCVDARLWL